MSNDLIPDRDYIEMRLSYSNGEKIFYVNARMTKVVAMELIHDKVNVPREMIEGMIHEFDRQDWFL